MIDREDEVRELLSALNGHLPMEVYANPPLVPAIREHCARFRKADALTIDSVLYLGDEGGIACGIRLPGTPEVVVASITHLRVDSGHPLAGQIQAYQSRRSRQLEEIGASASGRSQTGVATRPKRQRAGASNRNAASGNDLDLLQESACQLWQAGEHEVAAVAFRDLLERRPDDLCCGRYWLASCLFFLESFTELDALLEQRDDQSGIWRFAQALRAFQRHGDTEESQRLLVEADHLEPDFEGYLLRDKTVDARRVVRFDAGKAERAFGCARLFLPAWRAAPGAASWARRILKVPPTPADSDDVERRFPLDDLRALPLRRETWQVGLVLQPEKPGDEPRDEHDPIWLFGVADVRRQEMRAVTVIDQPLTETVVWNALIESFCNPMEGRPARPATLVVCRREFFLAWKPLLEEFGVRCRYQENLQPIGQLLMAMGEVIQQRETPPSSDIDVSALPQTDAVWQAGYNRSPAWVMNERDGAYRPWTVLVLEKSRSHAVLTDHTPGDPMPEMLFESLLHAMARPQGRSPKRPRLVEVADSDCYDHLRSRLEAVGVACRLVDEMREFDGFCLRLAKSFDGPGKCAMADGKHVTRPQMESFYEAASYYFREAPWRRVPGEVPIEIRCDDPDMGTRYGVVLGRSGVQLGLCVNDDWEATQAMLGGYSGGENLALAVCYDEPQILSAVDLQLIDKLGWPIATPEAYPAVMRLQPRRTPRSASAKELVFLDACLRALPDFISSKAHTQTRQVDTGTRPVELHLAWPGDAVRHA